MTTTATKSRPILFSGPMVRAILDGRKTQTRRAVKDVPDWCLSGDVAAITNGAGEWAISQLGTRPRVWPPDPKSGFTCPYGQPGDELWVRETWRPLSEFDPSPETGAAYWADSHVGLERRNGDAKWRPSIHMPRWASRITLTVTAVRVERLQDISEADAIAEGCSEFYGDIMNINDGHVGTATRPRRFAFRDLWQSINGPDSWDANPWVWVVEFERKAVG